MQWILADIISLTQYLTIDLKKEAHKNRCPNCGIFGLWRHGGYPRKADRLNNADDSLNPIYIQRYLCPYCHKTCSALPECIPPRRWYLWDIQQIALTLFIAGTSLRSIAQQIIPSRRTIGRWMAFFKEKIYFHKDVLCNHMTVFGRTSDAADFWRACLGHFSLAKAMRLCHVSGVSIL